MRSVVLEGLVIGLIASVIGLVLGLGLAKGMVALFSALGVELPDATTVVATKTIVVSLVLGTGIMLLASILPAKRATRVPRSRRCGRARSSRPRGWPRIRTTPDSASRSRRSRRSPSASSPGA
jgi:predicted lysophospholipase L1 biosynthesis ABC-type transport system permease subunit